MVRKVYYNVIPDLKQDILAKYSEKLIQREINYWVKKKNAHTQNRDTNKKTLTSVEEMSGYASSSL